MKQPLRNYALSRSLPVLALTLIFAIGVGLCGRAMMRVTSPARQPAQDASRERVIQEALIKRTILRAAQSYESWWAHNDRSYLGFLENADNANLMDSLIVDLKSRHIDAYYYTHSGKDVFVIKIRQQYSSVFYCFDSSDMSLEVKEIIASGDNYKSPTTCSGTEI